VCMDNSKSFLIDSQICETVQLRILLNVEYCIHFTCLYNTGVTSQLPRSTIRKKDDLD